MSSHITIEKISEVGVRQVWSVADFARRHRICQSEEDKLRKLFGDFATKQELLANAQRPLLFR